MKYEVLNNCAGCGTIWDLVLSPGPYLQYGDRQQRCYTVWCEECRRESPPAPTKREAIRLWNEENRERLPHQDSYAGIKRLSLEDREEILEFARKRSEAILSDKSGQDSP